MEQAPGLASMPQKGNAEVVSGAEEPTPAVGMPGEKGEVEVGTGGEGPTLAAVKSGEADAATGATVPSPAPWLAFGDKTMSDLQGAAIRAVSSVSQTASGGPRRIPHAAS